MNLRSHGRANLIEEISEIRQFERENVRARREQERLEHLAWLGVMYEPGLEGHNKWPS